MTDMNLQNTSAYLTGLLHMASSCSEWIGRSYIEADCFDPASFPQSFAQLYGLDAADIETAASPKTLRQMLAQWLGGDRPSLTDALSYHIRRKLGEETAVYTLPEDSPVPAKLSWSDGGQSPFYTVEELFFAAFPDAVVCFIMGNNE